MKRPMTTLALLLLAGCSSLQPSPAPSASLVPAPVVIEAETQDQIPPLMDALEAGQPLSQDQSRLALKLIRLLHIEREKMRAAKLELSEN